MNKVMKWISIFVLSFSWALSDQIAVVVNKRVITETAMHEYIDAFAKFSENEQYSNDSEFQSYVVSMIVTQYLLEDFANANNIGLTSAEKERALAFVMSNQGREASEFDAFAKELGANPDRLKMIVLGSALQQKIGTYVIGPTLEITDDEIAHAKHQHIAQYGLYKMKIWTIDLDEGESIDSIKHIKHQWAETGEAPSKGEVQDLGWKKRSDLPELFLKAIEGVSPGNLVGPIQSSFGYHLIWFEGEELPQMPIDEDIRQALLQQKYAEKYMSWLEDLQKYNVVIYK